VAHFKWPITRTSSRDVSRRPGPLSSNRAEDCDGQAFFQRIDIDEDNDIRVGYATPFDALCDPELQADALTWAAHAKTPIGSTTSSEDGPEATSLNLTRLGCLSSTFGNSAPKTKILVSRLDRGVYEVSRRPQDTAPKDDRGPVVRTVETAQTFLTASEVDALVGDYLAGMSVKALAERYGIHRATVFAHLRRRNVPSRRPGLGIDEKAEAVRLARAGVSMRAIGRRMGVDRKAVRAALVEAGLIADESASSS
jgi:DNA-binding CsgD family transcriptional regulator